MRVVATFQMLGSPLGQPMHRRDPEVAEDAVMPLAILAREQAEEQEGIAHADALIGKMRLRRPDLAEQTAAIAGEHRIVMALALRAVGTLARLRSVLAQPEIAIGRARDPLGIGDRQADRLAIDDGRGAPARSTVEPFAAEDDLHASTARSIRTSRR